MPATAALAAAPLPLASRAIGPTVGLAARSGSDSIADHEAPLIWRAQAGDRDAFGELYSRHQDHVRRYLTSRLYGRAADVEDLVAETFLAAMQRISTFQIDRPGEFGNWLVGIARNKLLGWHTRRASRETAMEEQWSSAGAIAESASPEDVALDRLEVADALSRLTPRARRALVLQHVEDLSSAEVALALGTTKRSIWALTGWARSELRGQVRRCACGCGAAIRPERWGRDRYATGSCRRQAAVTAPPLCACGCGAELPAVRPSRRRYATRTCRYRAAWRRRQEAQRRYLAGSVTADPAVEHVLAVVREAGSAGITRTELARRTRLLAARLDRAIDLLAGRWSISVVLEPCDGRLIVRYRALAGATARRAA
jgi:RNA polymerase sigma-70 factor, ECF subfamily